MQWSFSKGAKSPAIAIAAMALLTLPAFAQPPGSERTAAALMTVEHQWLAALNRHDVPTLARILGREFMDSDFQGDAITRAQYLAYFARPVSRSAPRILQTFEDTKVRFVAGGDVAIVTGIVTTRPAVASSVRASSGAGASSSVRASSGAGASSGANDVQHSRFSDVFVWRDGRWQAITGQETHFIPAKG